MVTCHTRKALQAKDGLTAPAYQAQEAAYTQMLADLETSILSLNNSADMPTNDVMYQGNIDQWRKYGYSLMLRMAMRVSEVDAALAQTYVAKAVAGGVFTSSDDDALIPADNANGFANGTANALNVVDDVYEVRWSNTLIDFLSATDAYRAYRSLPKMSLRITANRRSLSIGDSDPAIQIGLPNGFDLRGGATDISDRHSGRPEVVMILHRLEIILDPLEFTATGKHLGSLLPMPKHNFFWQKRPLEILVLPDLQRNTITMG